MPDSVANPPRPAEPSFERPEARNRAAAWWLDVSVRWKVLAVLVLPLLALVPALVVAAVLTQREPEVRSESRAAAAQARDARQVQQLITDAGLAARSYASTLEERYLVPYEDSLVALDEELARLQASAGPDTAEPVEELSAATEDIRRILAAVVLSVGDLELGGPDVRVAVATAERSLNEVRDAVAEIIAITDEQVADGRASLDDLTRWQLIAIVAGIAVGTAAALAGALALTRAIGGRLRRVAENADRYSRGEQPMPTPVSRDEIGQMEIKLAEASLRLEAEHAETLASRDQAMAATRAKDEFLSRMSHELRTPLTAVIGFGQLLQLSELSDDDRESADLVVKAGRHLLDLINEVLDISRIETGNLSLSLEPLPLHDLVTEATDLMGPAAAARGITIEDRTDPTLVVMADRQRLKQVLLNLVSNAVKYNHDGGRVAITAAVVEPGTVRASVLDTGRGIAPDGLSRVFDPFERLEAVHTAVEGTGVGLALSKALVEAMGGTVGVTSELGVGSTFWVDLVETELPALEPSRGGAATLVPGGGADGTVLYIEDNPANVRLMQRLFRDRIETLEVVAQGGLGLELARQLRPSMVLLDLHLPDLDGREVLSRLQADPTTRDIPVVVLSADASARLAQRLVDQGAAAYVTKPIDVAELLALVERLTST